MKLRRILAATDFSELARSAVQRAASLAAARDAELFVTHVYDAGRFQADVNGAPPPRPKDERLNAALILEALCADLAGARATPLLLDGFPDEQIVIAARAQAVDLIVVASHGRTGLARLVTGSVAENVVRRAEVPVLVHRGPAERGAQRVLAPTDFSPHAGRALEAVLALAEPRARVDLFHLVHVPAASEGTSGFVVDEVWHEALEQAALRRGAELVARTPHAEIDLRFECGFAAPRGGILAKLDEGYDLVALGSHGRRGLQRLLLGSVAEHVVRHAPCSVLIAK